MEVRDGDGPLSPVIGRFCGDGLPPPIKSSGSALHILFSSDGYNNFNGFVLIFQESAGRYSHLQAEPANTINRTQGLAVKAPHTRALSVAKRLGFAALVIFLLNVSASYILAHDTAGSFLQIYL